MSGNWICAHGEGGVHEWSSGATEGSIVTIGFAMTCSYYTDVLSLKYCKIRWSFSRTDRGPKSIPIFHLKLSLKWERNLDERRGTIVLKIQVFYAETCSGAASQYQRSRGEGPIVMGREPERSKDPSRPQSSRETTRIMTSS